MRSTEIEARRAELDAPGPTYRQLDTWTRRGLLTSNMRGDRHGRFRDWPDEEVETALLVARLIHLGLSEELSFLLARTEKARGGVRKLILDGGAKPHVTVSVG